MLAPAALTVGGFMSAWCSFKIQRISDAEERDLLATDVPRTLMELQAMGRWDGLQIFPDAEPEPDGHWQFPRISAGWEDEGRGYVVQCFENTDPLSYLLSTSEEVSEPEVYTELGSATQELWPRQLFVPYDTALKAIQHFLASGLQDPALSWVGLCNFPRKTVARRAWRPSKRE
jgi:hypothetical protein